MRPLRFGKRSLMRTTTLRPVESSVTSHPRAERVSAVRGGERVLS